MTFILVVCMTIFHANYSCCPFCVERMLSLTYEWVMSHIWMSHVLHMSHIWIIRVVPFVWKECCPSGIWMSRVSHMNESCLTYVSHMNYSYCPFCVERMLSLLCATVVPFVCRFSRLFWVYTPISVGADAYRCIVRYQHPKEPSNRAKEPYNKWKEPDNACVILSIDVLSGSFHLL